MFKKGFLYYLLVGFVFAAGNPAFAQTKDDEEGSKDHPMVSRYEGSYITAYERYAYDRLALGTGIKDEEVEEITVEGAVTRNVYKGPDGRSSLEIFRNYQMALTEAGFEILYKCIDDHFKCMDFAHFQIGGYKYGEVAHSGKDARYLYAKLANPNGDIFVSLHTAVKGQTPYTLLQVVEEKPMDTGKVNVDIDAQAMADDIDETGSVRLYGIHFDTNEATIKEKSESTLAEIADLMDQQPELRLNVVGHTDAVGDINYNMDLSRKRAEAVVAFLSSQYGVAEGRLKAHGIGPLAPVASNEDEDGRARNRRVELVKILDD
ncbi:MAG: OmpA family protein [Pseudomonadota bacterium]